MKRIAPRRRACALAIPLVVVAGALACGGQRPPGDGPPPAPISVSDGRYLMGTVLDVTLLGDDADALRTHLDWVFDEVARIEQVASRHRDDSELSRLNAAAGSAPTLGWSPHLRALLERSVRGGRTTGGAFDVTVGPLVGLWWRSVEQGRWPARGEIAAARALVGFDAVVVRPDGALGLARAGARVDLGGIAKGYALDVVRAGLAERGITRGLLDFGGSSVWALGRAPGGGPWRLEVDAREPGGPRRVLALVDRALSVSSSLGESSTIGERRVGHVVDPRTGLTVGVSRTAVVVASNATEAEVWSTALLVLDADEGMSRVGASPGLSAWVRAETGAIAASPSFAGWWADAESGDPHP